MRRLLSIGASILWMTGATGAMAQDTWVQRDSVNGPPKGACVSFVLENEGYIGLGRNFDSDKRSFYAFDPVQNDWDDEESLGGISGDGLNRGSAVAFVVDEKAYVGLGQGADPFFQDFWKYDPVTKVWTQLADFGGTGRRQAVAFAIDSAGYVGTGIDVTGYKKDFWKYLPSTNQWTQVADFAGTARKQAVAFTMHGKAFVGTGDDGAFRKDFWMYDPALDSWTPKADFGGTARYAATAFSIQSQGFVMTGYDSNLQFRKDVWEYNFYSNSWVQRGDFPGSARSNASAFVIGQTAYFGTGFDGNDYLDDFYEYQRIVSNDQPAWVDIRLFPNPATERVMVEFEGLQDVDLQVFDMQGRVMFRQDGIHCQSGSNQCTIDVSNLSPGAYFLSVHDQGAFSHSKKFVVTK